MQALHSHPFRKALLILLAACATPTLSKGGCPRLATQPPDHSYSAPGRDRNVFSGQAAWLNPAPEPRGYALFLSGNF